MSEQNPFRSPAANSPAKKKHVSDDDRNLVRGGAILAGIPLGLFLISLFAFLLKAPSPHPLLSLLAMLGYAFCTMGALVICPIAAWKTPNWISIGSLVVVAIDVVLPIMFLMPLFD